MSSRDVKIAKFIFDHSVIEKEKFLANIVKLGLPLSLSQRVDWIDIRNKYKKFV